MPFQIIRNDITNVRADAIVNTANLDPVFSRGTDGALFRAAGEEALLDERKQIGHIPAGEAAVTPAFGLDAGYIIHTVGPVWQGGGQGEADVLRSCYRNSLRLAREQGCESIAFPLISTGVNGFPKEEALQIAVSESSAFLAKEDMMIWLVVFDRESFALSEALFAGIDSYIDDHYVADRMAGEYEAAAPAGMNGDSSAVPTGVNGDSPAVPVGVNGDSSEVPTGVNGDRPAVPAGVNGDSSAVPTGVNGDRPAAPADVNGNSPAAAAGMNDGSFAADRPKSHRNKSGLLRNLRKLSEKKKRRQNRASEPAAMQMPQPSFMQRDAAEEKAPVPPAAAQAAFPSAFPPKTKKSAVQERSLEDVVAHLGETFQQRLFRLIDERGMTDVEVYKKANLDRKLFSKIRCNAEYRPKKITVVALAMALELNLDETKDLLSRAEMALSPSSKFDLIITYFIEREVYDIYTINIALFQHEQPLLGA